METYMLNLDTSTAEIDEEENTWLFIFFAQY
jgi:hypothetical protein